MAEEIERRSSRFQSLRLENNDPFAFSSVHFAQDAMSKLAMFKRRQWSFSDPDP